MKRTTKPKAKRKAREAIYSTESWERPIKRKARKVTRSAKTGKWVPNELAASDPLGTVSERIASPVATKVLAEVEEILAAEGLKPKTRVRRALDRIAAAWHSIGG